MYEIIATIIKYALTFIIYLFIYRIAGLIHRDIKSLNIWEASKVTNPHLKLLSSIAHGEKQTVTEIFPLIKGVSTLGRGLEAQIVISDPHVSSKHLQVEFTANGFVARDLGSVNGSYVNKTRISQPVLLSEGDEIEIGVSKLVFSEGRGLDG